jgi:hypothetical protein
MPDGNHLETMSPSPPALDRLVSIGAPGLHSMPMYATEYRLPKGGRAQTTCYAMSAEHLAETLKLRNLGEVPTGRSFPAPVMASQHLRRRDFAEANHALVWASMIATKAGIVDAWDLLNDNGLLHEMAHVAENGSLPARFAYDVYFGCTCDMCRGIRPDDRDHPFILQVEAFERRVPGLHPSWGREVEVRPAMPRADTSLTVAVDGASIASIDAFSMPPTVFVEPKPIANPRRRGFDRQQIRQGSAARAAMIEAQVAKLRARPKPKKTVTVSIQGMSKIRESMESLRLALGVMASSMEPLRNKRLPELTAFATGGTVTGNAANVGMDLAKPRFTFSAADLESAITADAMSSIRKEIERRSRNAIYKTMMLTPATLVSASFPGS